MKEFFLKINFEKIQQLTFYSIIIPFDTFGIYPILNIMENEAFALLEQMVHLP